MPSTGIPNLLRRRKHGAHAAIVLRCLRFCQGLMIPFHVWQITYFSLKDAWIASRKFSNEVIYEPAEFLGRLNIPLKCETSFLSFVVPSQIHRIRILQNSTVGFFSPASSEHYFWGENQSDKSIMQRKTFPESQSHWNRGVLCAPSKPALFARLWFAHQNRGPFPLPLFKRQIKREPAAALWKVSTTFVLDIGCAMEGSQASGLFLAEAPLFGSWWTRVKSEQQDAIREPRGRLHVWSHHSRLQPAWVWGVGSVFCVKCLVSDKGSASELKYPPPPRRHLAFIFFFLYKNREPKSLFMDVPWWSQGTPHQKLRLDSRGKGCVCPDTPPAAISFTRTRAQPGWWSDFRQRCHRLFCSPAE